MQTHSALTFKGLMQKPSFVSYRSLFRRATCIIAGRAFYMQILRHLLSIAKHHQSSPGGCDCFVHLDNAAGTAGALDVAVSLGHVTFKRCAVLV